MKGKDELEGTRSNFTPWLCDFEHQGGKPLGWLVQPPLGELGLGNGVSNTCCMYMYVCMYVFVN